MKRNLILLFIFIATIGYSQTASTTVSGRNGAGTATPILVENDGRVKVSLTAPYTNGSADTQALLDAENSVMVNMAKDSRRKAVKTTSNHIASATPQTITLIPNCMDVTVILSETGKVLWLKVGANDAGEDNGSRITSFAGIENCATDTVISYYASPSVKFSVVQE